MKLDIHLAAELARSAAPDLIPPLHYDGPYCTRCKQPCSVRETVDPTELIFSGEVERVVATANGMAVSLCCGAPYSVQPINDGGIAP
jgi:hypothetical protein